MITGNVSKCLECGRPHLRHAGASTAVGKRHGRTVTSISSHREVSRDPHDSHDSTRPGLHRSCRCSVQPKHIAQDHRAGHLSNWFLRIPSRDTRATRGLASRGILTRLPARCCYAFAQPGRVLSVPCLAWPRLALPLPGPCPARAPCPCPLPCPCPCPALALALPLHCPCSAIGLPLPGSILPS